MIRQFKSEDINQIKEIHEKFYKDEFSLIDFCQRFLNFFVIEEDEQIICAGGVRAIAESVIITNKDFSPKIRRASLYQMLDAQMFTCGKDGYKHLHAFIQDETWKEHLKKVGFQDCKGNALYIEVK